jgi:hypothetical protein
VAPVRQPHSATCKHDPDTSHKELVSRMYTHNTECQQRPQVCINMLPLHDPHTHSTHAPPSSPDHSPRPTHSTPCRNVRMKGMSHNTCTQKRILFYTSQGNHAWDWKSVRSKGVYTYGMRQPIISCSRPVRYIQGSPYKVYSNGYEWYTLYICLHVPLETTGTVSYGISAPVPSLSSKHFHTYRR